MYKIRNIDIESPLFPLLSGILNFKLKKNGKTKK